MLLIRCTVIKRIQFGLSLQAKLAAGDINRDRHCIKAWQASTRRDIMREYLRNTCSPAKTRQVHDGREETAFSFVLVSTMLSQLTGSETSPDAASLSPEISRRMPLTCKPKSATRKHLESHDFHRTYSTTASIKYHDRLLQYCKNLSYWTNPL